MKAYGAEVQAYNAEVQAFSALVAAKKTSLEGAAAVNQARSADYINKVESYKAIVSAHVAELQGKVSSEAQKIAAYGLELQDAAAQRDLEKSKMVVDFQIDKERYSQEWSAKVERAKLAMTLQNTLSSLHTANATIHGNLAQAALSGINVLAASTETV